MTVETEVHFALKVNDGGTSFLFPGNHVTGEGHGGYSKDIMSKKFQGQQYGGLMHGCLCMNTNIQTNIAVNLS